MKIKRSTEFINEMLGVNRENVKQISKPGFWSDAIRQARDGYAWFIKKAKEGFAAFTESGKQLMAVIPETILSYANEKNNPHAVMVASDEVVKNTHLQNGSLDEYFANNIKPTFNYNSNGGGVFNERLGMVLSGELVLEKMKQDKKRKLNAINEGKSSEPVYVKLSSGEIENIGTNEFRNILEKAIKQPNMIRPMIFGAPGIGKTTIVKNFIKECFGSVRTEGEFMANGGINLVLLQLENMEVSDFTLPGYKEIKNDKGEDISRRAIQCPFGYIPAYKPVGDMPERSNFKTNDEYENALKNSKDFMSDVSLGRGIIFMDEVNRCHSGVDQIAKHLVDREFAGGWAVGSNWALVGAGNRMADVTTGSVLKMDESMFRRFNPIVNYAPTYKEWRSWAEKYAFMNTTILDWIQDNANTVGFYHNSSVDSKNQDAAYMTTPASWEMCCYWLACAAKTAHDEGHSLSEVGNEDIIEFSMRNHSELQRDPGLWDIMSFSTKELKHQMMETHLDRDTVRAFITYFEMIQSVDVNRFKKEVWKKGVDTVKIEKVTAAEGEGASKKYVSKSASSAVIITVYKMAIEAKASTGKEPTVKEIKSLYDSLINYNESIAMTVVHAFFDVFPKIKENIENYCIMVQSFEKSQDTSITEEERKELEAIVNEYRGKLNIDNDEEKAKYYIELDNAIDDLQAKFPALEKEFDFSK